MRSVRIPRLLALGFAGLGFVGAVAGCSATAAGSTSTSYKDGSYTEEGSYQSPGGKETISVTLTIADNKVTAVTVTPEASGTAKGYQTQFAGGISDVVVGKDLSTLSVSRVAGSSLTSGGFNAAVKAIQADAAA